MKKILLKVIICSLVILSSQFAQGQSFDEINEEYDKNYDAIKPPSDSSSVGTDYLFERTALSTMQITRILKLIYEQNREMLSKYDKVINKYDEIIRQNNEIIKLLTKDGSKDESEY